MNQSTSLYLSALRQVEWQEPDKFSFPTQNAKNWLLEQGSLSRLLESHCQTLNVDLLHNKVVKAEKLDSQEIVLLTKEECLLRKVVLKGDQQPWVLGRTLIPQSSMNGQQYDLTRQGEIPLGLTVFNAENVKRDALQVGWAKTSDGQFLARRSRLWMNHKPMLVAELFLPAAPIYSKERGK
ncbi:MULTISPECIES: chorismate lyase [Vibrio]|uniref:Probable chorismate pyruvate-lyase n=1 Tax=Vibrio neptunius TaxID=170651 RepID=A0ABS3A5Z2_9VIBR|nr:MULTISPECIES: chorismate lyase [Vibrio]KJY90104.1 chorismate--pyruvate lyase [Vibrio neptunius]MBN3495072.1 chorismate lyase [Vibrio neptunius]MBN3517566.1 chorismate lyase [Vibrio neptunius]MBN3551903.1 chorismate lyase [Vibrio neptunius]MBN3575411.1 chorismate lyase [Vibrio neptunius]